MNQPESSIVVTTESLSGCNNPRDLLAHPDTQRVVALWNHKRQKEGEPVVTLSQIRDDQKLTAGLVEFVLALPMRQSARTAQTLWARIRSTQFTVDQIRWGHDDENCLDQPWDRQTKWSEDGNRGNGVE